MPYVKGWRRARVRIHVRDDGICAWCGYRVDPTNWDLDHVVPRWKGGGDEDSNLVVSHPSCNRGRTPKKVDPLPRANVSRW
jgi:5-methylcytosine-specific restriction enzyme A